MKLFSGTSNPALAQSIADRFRNPLGQVEITRFIDNECRVYVREDVEGDDVYVVQSLSKVADQHLVELCLLGSALKGLKAGKVTAVIPWMGYSKQDKAFRKGEAISAQLVARFIQSAGFDAVITMELHSENVLPFFSVPVTEISTHDLLRGALSDIVPSVLSADTVVVSPDKGGTSRSERFADESGLGIAYLTKTRDRQTGQVQVTGLEGDVRDKTVIIFDDIINTGATAVKSSAFVKAQGASAVYFLATHAVFAGDAVSGLSSGTIDRVVVTDSIYLPPEKRFGTLSVVSCAPLLAGAIEG